MGTLPSIGSEIAAFDTKGNIVGSAVYSSPVTVLSVWGDDLTTSYKDGLEVSESIHIKVYQSGTLSDVKYIEWSEGSSCTQSMQLISHLISSLLMKLN